MRARKNFSAIAAVVAAGIIVAGCASGSADHGTVNHPPAAKTSVSYYSWGNGQATGMDDLWNAVGIRSDDQTVKAACNAYLVDNPEDNQLLTGETIDHTAFINGCINGWHAVNHPKAKPPRRRSP